MAAVREWGEGMSSDNMKGLVLALSSSLFIGASFIVKKKGLKKAGASGTRAGIGGYSYLLEPLWWAGMITMVLGEIANFAAYAFAPAILVTPLAVFILIFRFVPQYGQTHIMVYIGVCSLVGSISVMSVKALGIALKLTFSGMNQLLYPQTWAFTLVVIACVLTQMNYLNKDWDRQSPTQIITEICGFVTILSGTFLLHKTKDMVEGMFSGALNHEPWKYGPMLSTVAMARHGVYLSLCSVDDSRRAPNQESLRKGIKVVQFLL
ncbi:hypothetical protein V6N12_056068 [Hibiscus sabdariffa]|uniref:Probable magnesium transporter n=1 Tax=Hibiscus sabdariffa TaxID=183260 RepID=A0ABR2CTT2_9ROSI